MKTSRFSKLFFCISFLCLLILTIFYYHDMKYTRKKPVKENIMQLDKIIQQVEIETTVKDDENKLKYILQWTNPKNVPFVYMGKGQQGFIDYKCPFTNCYVTGDKNYFDGDYTKFDVIAFSGPELIQRRLVNLPEKRSVHQKYVFASIESPNYYPLCSNKLDGFFNWTWTYKTDSDARWGYLVIRDSEKKVIGPNTDMHWMDLQDMDPVSDDLIDKLKNKTKAAAWFVSNCYSRSNRESFVDDLNKELREYGLGVDIYGACGPLKCPRENHSECVKLIERDYYFYLSFENSFSEDYVTEKLVNALQHNAVPVVFGGANYTRFMPDGIYLDARKLGAKKLASKMNSLINNPQQYFEYFRWKNHYSYYRRMESIETDDYCRFCSMLNEPELVKSTTVYENFRDWWMRGAEHSCDWKQRKTQP